MINKTLNGILDNIRQGGEVGSSALLPFLCAERRTDRFFVNAEVARACSSVGKPERATVFADRALLLSGFSEEFLPFYVELQTALGNVSAIKNAYKQTGMRMAAAGNIVSALHYFNLHHYAHLKAENSDYYEYDFDILAKVAELAGPRRYTIEAPLSVPVGSQIRLAYLVFGASHSQSVLIKILHTLARYHDRARYEVAFFVPDCANTAWEYARSANINKLRGEGARVIPAESTDALECLNETNRSIRKFKPHILVTTAVLADYSHYFITAREPDAIKIGLGFGPPAQYAVPSLDWLICATKHPLIDSPCDGSVINLEVDLPNRESVPACSRAELGIPVDAIVIMCAGRQQKFQSRGFWAAIFDVIEHHPQAFFVAVGLSQEPPFLSELLTPARKARFVSFGWRSDYLSILATADVVVDTFPSGGGVTLMDAMALAIPIVSFRNDYLIHFDQTNWNPAEEIVEFPELLVSRGRFDEFAKILSRLIDDRDYRKRMGRQCQESAMRRTGSPHRMVRNYEKTYEKVLDAIAKDSRSWRSRLELLRDPRSVVAPT